MESKKRITYLKAKRKVEMLKGFYRHLIAYLIINSILLIIRGNILGFFENKSPDQNFLEWVDWNILIVPIFWGIGLLCHAIYVFFIFNVKSNYLKNWEEKKIQQFLEEDS